jgi:ophiobolin F synthase
MLPECVLHPYSVPVEKEKVTGAEASDAITVRINRHNELADVGSVCIIGDWARIMKDGQDMRSNVSPSRVGNWTSFIYPETRPEKLGLLAYILDLACIHEGTDEHSEVMVHKTLALTVHRRVRRAVYCKCPH